LRIRRIGRLHRNIKAYPWNIFWNCQSAVPKPAAHLAWAKNLFTTFLEPNKNKKKNKLLSWMVAQSK